MRGGRGDGRTDGRLNVPAGVDGTGQCGCIITDMETPRLKFGADQRLKKTAQFDAVYAQRRSASDYALLVFALPNTKGRPRLGVSVSKKHGNAPVRNRLKRILREGFRLVQHELPAFDYVLVPKDAKRLSVVQVQQALPHLAGKIARKFQKAGDGA
jgi:ribonuclease P protein component